MLSRPKFLLLPLALLVASCGLKGPLYRPDEPRNDTTTPADPAATAKKKPGETSAPPTGTPVDPARPAVPPDR